MLVTTLNLITFIHFYGTLVVHLVVKLLYQHSSSIYVSAPQEPQDVTAMNNVNLTISTVDQ